MTDDSQEVGEAEDDLKRFPDYSLYPGGLAAKAGAGKNIYTIPFFKLV